MALTTQKQFKPTNEQILAAMEVFTLMAIHSLVLDVFEKTETAILLEGDYPVDEKYNDPKFAGLVRENRVVNGMVKDHRATHMIAGLKEYCDDETVVNPTSKYYAELRKRTQQFVHAENTSCMISNALIKAEQRFGILTEDISGIKFEDIIMLDHRKQYLDLTLRLFAPLVNTYTGREAVSKRIYQTYMKPQITEGLRDEWAKMQDFLNAKN